MEVFIVDKSTLGTVYRIRFVNDSWSVLVHCSTLYAHIHHLRHVISFSDITSMAELHEERIYILCNIQQYVHI